MHHERPKSSKELTIMADPSSTDVFSGRTLRKRSANMSYKEPDESEFLIKAPRKKRIATTGSGSAASVARKKKATTASPSYSSSSSAVALTPAFSVPRRSIPSQTQITPEQLTARKERDTPTATFSAPRRSIPAQIHVTPEQLAECAKSCDYFSPLLESTYGNIKSFWPNDNPNVPPVDGPASSFLAHEYMAMWAPPPGQVDLMVLAESHARTDEKVLGRPLRDDIPLSSDIRATHKGHLNVVQCLSYGEPSLLSGGVSDLPESIAKGVASGTRRFFQLLSVFSGQQDTTDGSDPLQIGAKFDKIFHNIQGKQAKLQANRLENKISILKDLRQRGIMLADICPVPIYAGGGSITRHNKKTGKAYKDNSKKLPDTVKSKILNTAWETYASNLIRYYRPRHVLVLGKTLKKSIGFDVIRSVVEERGGIYLSAEYHPSSNQCMSNENFLHMLVCLRQLASEVQHSRVDDVNYRTKIMFWALCNAGMTEDDVRALVSVKE